MSNILSVAVSVAALVILCGCMIYGLSGGDAIAVAPVNASLDAAPNVTITGTTTPNATLEPTPSPYRDRGIPYYDGSGTVPAVLYDPTGDEAEVRFAIQIEKKRDATILDPVVYKDPDARLICRVHPGDGAIVHVTAVRHGSINYYTVPI